ncbi:MAG: EF-hand domain-containing protein [Casimicrobium sp.]
MNAFTPIGLTAVLALVASIASAAPGGKFAAADSNRDGTLTKAEACIGKTRSVCKNFDAMDANKDGAVTRAEIKAYRNAKRVAQGMPPKL